MIEWIGKKILRAYIDDVVKKDLPDLKDKAKEYIREHKDEFFEIIKEKLKQAIKDFVASKVNR